MPTKQTTLVVLTPLILEANPHRKSLFIQKIDVGTDPVYISEGVSPIYPLGTLITGRQYITLPTQYDWFEANKALGWNTENVWYLLVGGASAVVVINEGIEYSETTTAKPVSRPM